VCQEVDPDANIIVGATFDDGLGDRIRVSIVASGMPRAAALEPPREADLPMWTPRSQREPLSGSMADPFGRRLADVLGAEPEAAMGGRPAPRSRARARKPAVETDAAGLAPDATDTPGSDGLSALAKSPAARARRGANGRKPGEGAPRRPPLPPPAPGPFADGAEAPPGARRRARRAPADSPPPPVNWRELTAPGEAPIPPPPPPVNWRGLTASQSPPPEPSRDLMVVPQRESDLMPRRMGFLERLGFGRRRQA
jgi:cell division protein FtsZ